jgi:hypothetical protein
MSPRDNRPMVPLLVPLLMAGIIYHFTAVFTDNHGTFQSSGKVYVEGTQYRLELDHAPGRSHAYDIAISRDADVTAALLNVEKKTWQDRVRASHITRSSMLFQFPFPGGEVVGAPIILHRDAGFELVAGHATRKHIITIEYRLHATDEEVVIDAKVHATATIWTADDLPKLPLERDLQTGWPEVDRELKNANAKLTGMAVRSELVVTRTFEGGQPITEKTRNTIDELRVADVPGTLFEIPPAFRYDAGPVAPRNRD